MTKTPRWLSADDAVAHVQSGMSVCFGHMSAEPTALTSALWARAETVKDLHVYAGMLISGYRFLSMPCAPNIRFKTWFMPGALLRAGDVDADYMPLTWAQSARFLMETPMDVGMIHVSPADAEGYHSLGVNCSVNRALVARSRFLIGQVNANMPRTLGDSRVHSSQFDVLVDATEPLIAYPDRPIDDIDANIGRRMAEFIPDGASLSFGVGGIPGAVAQALITRGARDMHIINTFTDPAMELIRRGCAHSGRVKAEVGDIFGSEALYRWIDGNEAVALADATKTHSVESLVARKTVVSVNSALEVDLFGQLNTETIGGKQAGAMGGLLDFAVAGQVQGGKFLIGLRSRTNGGKPRIVTRLDSAVVSLTRTFVETVVTEYGVANLRNKTVNERAVALAGIAHPGDRDALLNAAATMR